MNTKESKKYLFKTITNLITVADILNDKELNQLKKEELIRSCAKTDYAKKYLDAIKRPITCDDIINMHTEEYVTYANILEKTDDLFKEKFRNIFIEKLASLELIKAGACTDTDEFGKYKHLTREQNQLYNSVLDIIPEWMSNITYA